MSGSRETRRLTLSQTWREPPLWWLVGIVVAVGLVSMPAEIYPGDPMTMREETRSLLLHGDLAVEDVIARTYTVSGAAGQYVVANPRDDRSYSKYGSMAAWMYLLPMGAELLVEGDLPPFTSPRRVIYLNTFNLLLSVLIAASLYRTARRFAVAPWPTVIFVTLCFYSTYLWNYLRAQNSEIIQLLFFAWAVTGFLDVLDERRHSESRLGVARLWAACTALFLTKVSYVFIGPLFATGLLVDRWQRTGGPWRRLFYSEAQIHLIPATAMLMLWGTLNWWKFGHPLLTGYHLWKPEQHGLNGSLLDSLPKLLFSVQWGFVFCFPILALALPWLWCWLRKRPIAFGTIVAIGGVYLVLLGLLPSWTGAWCYGPRYWLFILPFVALPAVSGLKWLRQKTVPAVLSVVLVTVCLGYSTWLQLQVNRFPFFAYYHLAEVPGTGLTASGQAFFTENSYGWIEYSLWHNRGHLERLPWWRDQKEIMSAEQAKAYEEHVQNVLGRGNLFFFKGGGRD